MSDAATAGNARNSKVLMMNDVSRAFFEASMQRNLCIKLPEEDKSEKDRRRDMVGHLNPSLYSTPDAAATFLKECKKFIQKICFGTGRHNPSTRFHKERKLRTLVRADDSAMSSG